MQSLAECELVQDVEPWLALRKPEALGIDATVKDVESHYNCLSQVSSLTILLCHLFMLPMMFQWIELPSLHPCD